MRFLADENFPGDAVSALRTSAQDVLWIRTDAPGITDQDVLARSLKDARVLLTFDKDFGELAWRSRLPASCGISTWYASREDLILSKLVCARDTVSGDATADVRTLIDESVDWPCLKDWAAKLGVAAKLDEVSK